MPKDPNLPDPNDRKKMMFWESPKRQAELKIRLQIDGFTQSHFFRALITGYLEKNESIMSYIDSYKDKQKLQGLAKRKTIKKDLELHTDTKKRFGLDENEIEDIFDIIAEEFPEL
jgi:hypothetical protein|tara:strand:+ start:300 stop:644 length:345 start_codon:yes stop_codon:yes gene_type:complete